MSTVDFPVGERIHATPLNLKHPLNLSSRDFIHNEYAYYAWLRREAPVYKGKFSVMNLYFISRYDDVVEVLKDKRFIRNRANAFGGSRLPFPAPKVLQSMASSMILEDEPEHRRLRNLVHKAFTPQTVGNLAGRIESLTHQLLDEAERAGQVDLVQAYALPIPITVIADMLGVPESDRPTFLKYSQSFQGMPNALTFLRWYLNIRSIDGYTRDLIARRRADPQDDLLTALIQAEDDDEQLSEDELVSMVILLLFAGYETTVNLIANGVWALLQHPDQLQRLRDDMSLMDSAIEEILRYDSPVGGTKPMYASEDIALHGVTIPKKAAVMALVGSANRDETIFTNPDQFDIARSPNKHIGFGQGIHYCLGAPLARLEGKIALTNLLKRAPNLRLAVEPAAVKYVTRPMWHRLENLPVRLD